MPDIRQQSTIDALAQAFCSNDRKQEQAMIQTGYSKAYARSYCGQLWANSRIIAAIAKIDGKQAKKQEVTRQYCIDKLQRIVENSPIERNILSAISLLGDFTGDKRALAPNPLAMAGIRARMSAEEELSRLAHAKERTKALSESKPAFPRINKETA